MTQRIYLVHSADGKIGPEEFRTQSTSIGRVFKVKPDGTVGLVKNTFADIEGNPTDNTNLATALGEKIPWTSILDSESVSNANLWSSEYSKSKIDALTAVASIKVVDAYPDTPVNGTMYYCGTSAPFQIYFYVNDTKYDFGQTPVDMSSYLKTSGGTMNGSIVVNHAIVSGQYAMRSDVNTAWISFNGGAGYGSGASMDLYGCNHSTNPGQFVLRAYNSSGYSDLTGTPQKLYWRGYQIGFDDNDHMWLYPPFGTTSIMIRKMNGIVHIVFNSATIPAGTLGYLAEKYRPSIDINLNELITIKTTGEVLSRDGHTIQWFNSYDAYLAG